MTKYAVVWSERAERQAHDLEPTIRRRIHSAVGHAAADPLRYAMRLVGSPYYRLRVGDWRVIIEIDQGRILVLVLDVGHRSTIYR